MKSALFDPNVLSSIQSFDWLIKALAKGAVQGTKWSRKIGVGQEFSQYRPYSQGDDLRRLDWKMYGKTERFYIKESDIETDISISFFLDDSPSMKYEEGDWSKFNLSKAMIGTLAFIANHNGDQFALHTSSSNSKLGQGPKHWLGFLKQLYECQAAHQEPLSKFTGKRHEVVVVFTDLYDQSGQLMKTIKSFKTKNNEVIVFHVLGPQEESMEMTGSIAFKDLETEKELNVSPKVVAKSYVKKLQAWKNEWKNEMLKVGIDYQLLPMELSPELVIRSFLQHRNRLV